MSKKARKPKQANPFANPEDDATKRKAERTDAVIKTGLTAAGFAMVPFMVLAFGFVCATIVWLISMWVDLVF